MANTSTRFSWQTAPDLMARLRDTQNHPAHAQRDILTFAGLCESREQLERHVVSCEAQAAAQAVREGLASAFGREWLRLSDADQSRIIRDCTEGDEIPDLAAFLRAYRQNIGFGNLQAYALTQRVRFTPAAPARVCGHCGGAQPVGQSCGCFDNGGE